MKHTLIMAVCLLSLISCTKKSSTTTKSSGSASTFSITIGGKTYTSGGAKVTTREYLTTSNGINHVEVTDVGNIMVKLDIGGLGTGIYNFQSATAGNTYVQTPTAIYSDNPTTNPAPCGTANITHTGADYFEGTFSITLTNAAYVATPATGSFKVYH